MVRLIYMLVFAFTMSSPIVTIAFASDIDSLSKEEKLLTSKCNRATKNFFNNGNIEKAEVVCLEAIRLIEKTHPNDERLVYPMLKLAVSYSFSGKNQQKAEALYNRALVIREKLYDHNSPLVTQAYDLIKMHEELVKRRKQEIVE